MEGVIFSEFWGLCESCRDFVGEWGRFKLEDIKRFYCYVLCSIKRV